MFFVGADVRAASIPLGCLKPFWRSMWVHGRHKGPSIQTFPSVLSELIVVPMPGHAEKEEFTTEALGGNTGGLDQFRSKPEACLGPAHPHLHPHHSGYECGARLTYMHGCFVKSKPTWNYDAN